MIKNISKILIRPSANKRYFSSNLNNSLNKEVQTISETTSLFSYINPHNFYLKIDMSIRDYIHFLAEDYNLGLGLGILISSLTMKLLLSPLIVKNKIISENMKNIKPLLDEQTAKLMEAYKSGDKENLLLESSNMKAFKKKYELNKMFPMIAFQGCCYFTWFISLRYLLSNKEIFLYINNYNFLWLDNWYTPDKFYILPVLIASLNFINITNNLKSNEIPDKKMKKMFETYLKLLPLISIPFLCFLPSGLLIHWTAISSFHLFITLFFNTKFMKRTLDEKFKNNK